MFAIVVELLFIYIDILAALVVPMFGDVLGDVVVIASKSYDGHHRLCLLQYSTLASCLTGTSVSQW